MQLCLRDEVRAFLCGFVRRCVCVGWVCARILICSSVGKKARRAPLFCFPLFKTVTRPRCRINDCDKKATPTGMLLQNPFPKYLLARGWCMSLCLQTHRPSNTGRKWEEKDAFSSCCSYLMVTFAIRPIFAQSRQSCSSRLARQRERVPVLTWLLRLHHRCLCAQEFKANDSNDDEMTPVKLVALPVKTHVIHPDALGNHNEQRHQAYCDVKWGVRSFYGLYDSLRKIESPSAKDRFIENVFQVPVFRTAALQLFCLFCN